MRNARSSLCTILALGVGVLAAGTTGALGAINLQRTDVPLVAGALPEALRVGDLDHAKGLDIVVALRQTNEVAVVLSNGGGTFAPVRRFAACPFPVDVEIGDITGPAGGLLGDGKNDVVVGCIQQNPSVVILPGLGGGNLGAPLPTDVARSDIFALIASGGGSERADIVALAPPGRGVRPPYLVVRGDRNAPIASARTVCVDDDWRPTTELFPESCNADGTRVIGPIVPYVIPTTGDNTVLGWGVPSSPGPADLAITSWTTPSANGWTRSSRPSGGNNIVAIATGDFEPDGDSDIVIGRYLNLLASPVDSVGVFKWEGTALPSTPPANVGSLGTIISLTLANLDGDRKPDLAVADLGREITVQKGNGDGTFGAIERPAAAFPADFTNSYTMTLDKGDVTGDGREDLVALDATASQLSIFRNTAPRRTFTSGVLILKPKKPGKPWFATFTLTDKATLTAVLTRRNAKGKFVKVKRITATKAPGKVKLALGKRAAGRYRLTLTFTDETGYTQVLVKAFRVS